MHCPECSGWMRESTFGDTTIDRCSSCNGTWFDRRDLRAWRRSVPHGYPVTRDVPSVFAPVGGPSDLACPSCENHRMEHGRVATIEVDRCRDCQGLFLTAANLAAINRRWKQRLSRLERDATEERGRKTGTTLHLALLSLTLFD